MIDFNFISKKKFGEDLFYFALTPFIVLLLAYTVENLWRIFDLSTVKARGNLSYRCRKWKKYQDFIGEILLLLNRLSF